MGQSVRVDGNLVRVNGDKVARALGDFSADALAEAVRLYLRKNQQFDIRIENGAFVYQELPPELLTPNRLGVCGPGGGIVAAGSPVSFGGPSALLGGVPQELLNKAQEYVPTGQIGLLRLYADRRGFSCQQVDAAISMVGGAA